MGKISKSTWWRGEPRYRCRGKYFIDLKATKLTLRYINAGFKSTERYKGKNDEFERLPVKWPMRLFGCA